jgi:glutathione S-transferase
MLHLHYYPSTASMVPHILLEELAVPYQRVLVDRAVDAHKSPEYLKLNPNGLIPVLVQDGMAGGAGAPLVLYETAAIVLHLCDTHLGAGLAPPVGSAERAHFYKWLMWLTNTLQATLIVYFYPERWVAQGNAAGAAEVKAAAEAKIAGLLDQLDGELARHGQVWFMGAAYSALDPTSSPCAAGRATSPRCRRVGGRTWAHTFSACWPARRCSACWRPSSWRRPSSDRCARRPDHASRQRVSRNASRALSAALLWRRCT